MAEEKKLSKNNEAADVKSDKAPVKENKKKVKPVEKKPNFFARTFKKIVKFFKDIVGEMKKVVWTSKEDLKKSTKLVLATVVAFGLAIAVVDTLFSWIINTIAGFIG